ncbi:hypothetical protein COLO4_32140 [Corchorus olitorius]|uniref:Uncharacterized protein n=1 Tax=Corchorus olitorius TaxID=93759 RepID=A0A1R3H119_9ROSI|nr:hypothetical protein COLO4_32140 [Corchorus olitorius]
MYVSPTHLPAFGIFAASDLNFGCCFSWFGSFGEHNNLLLIGFGCGLFGRTECSMGRVGGGYSNLFLGNLNRSALDLGDNVPAI